MKLSRLANYPVKLKAMKLTAPVPAECHIVFWSTEDFARQPVPAECHIVFWSTEDFARQPVPAECHIVFWSTEDFARQPVPTECHIVFWATEDFARQATKTFWLSCASVSRARCCWLLNVSATCKCISGTDLLRQFYVLPHWDTSCRSNSPSHPVTVYWHRAK